MSCYGGYYFPEANWLAAIIGLADDGMNWPSRGSGVPYIE